MNFYMIPGKLASMITKVGRFGNCETENKLLFILLNASRSLVTKNQFHS